MKHFIFSLSFIFLCTLSSQAQVGINTATPNASAALDVTSTDKGLLIPRVTSTANVTAPTAGMMVYQTGGTAGFYLYGPTGWTIVSPGVPTGGTANQVLSKVDGTNYNTQWVTPASGGGISLATEAAKNAMTSAPNGTLVYQTDEYKGIYAKESDGWRMQSGDTPITYITNLGTQTTAIPVPYTGPTLLLDASHHTIVVNGNWADTLSYFTLPAASSCKGRIYSFLIKNYWFGDNSPGQWTDFGGMGNDTHYYLYGFGLNFTNPNAYVPLDVNCWLTPDLCYSRGIPEYRNFAIQSNGTEWIEIEADRSTHQFYFRIE
jgi:hypothetical protein